MNLLEIGTLILGVPLIWWLWFRSSSRWWRVFLIVAAPVLGVLLAFFIVLPLLAGLQQLGIVPPPIGEGR